LGYRPKLVKDMKDLVSIMTRNLMPFGFSTPEHWQWHWLRWACQAAKDVYVEEKPKYQLLGAKRKKWLEAAEEIQ